MQSQSSSKKVLPLVFLTVFLDMLGMGILIPIFPMLVAPDSAFRIVPSTWTTAQGYILGGWLLAAFPIFQFFFSPILGQWSDHHGRKKTLAFSIFGSAVGHALAGFALFTSNLPLLFFARILDGATGGNISVAQASIADVSRPEDRPKNFGLVGVALGLGFIMGPAMGGILADVNIILPFFVAAGLSLTNSILVLARLPETNLHPKTTPIDFFRSVHNISRSLREKGIRDLLPALFVFNTGFTFFSTFLGVVLAVDFGYSQIQVGHFFAYLGLMIVLAQGGIVRRLSGKIQEHKVLRVSMILAALSLFPFCIIPSNRDYLLWFFPPILAIGMALTRAFGLSLLTRITREEIRGEVTGFHSSAYALAQAIPSVLAGYAAAYSARSSILVGFLFALFGYLLFLRSDSNHSRM